MNGFEVRFISLLRLYRALYRALYRILYSLHFTFLSRET